MPVIIPAGVDCVLSGGDCLVVKGKHGKLEFRIPDAVSCNYVENKGERGGDVLGSVVFGVKSDTPDSRAKWGLTRSIVANMVHGVSIGFTKTLEISGVGYKASVSGRSLTLYVGHSHDIVYALPEGVVVKCEKPTVVSIFGCDKQLVGQVAAEIRSLKKPEPYKGKGIRYSDEVVRRKAGKKK